MFDKKESVALIFSTDIKRNILTTLLSRDPITCKEPIEVVSYKIGVCKVSPNGKDCHTEFQRLSFNGKTSVVLCRPRTGRMHQIRVHLQFLGKNKQNATVWMGMRVRAACGSSSPRQIPK